MSDKKIINVNEQNLGLNEKLKNIKFDDAFDKKKLEKAQAAIDSSKEAFLEATLEDMKDLQEIFQRLSADSVKAEIIKMQDLAFSIKSRAGTAGYPIASQVAKSLFEFFEQRVEELDKEKFGVAKVHVSALDQILSDGFDLNDPGKSAKLMDGLHKLTHKD